MFDVIVTSESDNSGNVPIYFSNIRDITGGYGLIHQIEISAIQCPKIGHVRLNALDFKAVV
jgi:hypothetical protein